MKLKYQLIAASVLSAMTFGAAAEVSGYATLNSDYMFRGVTLNDNGPALQGGIDWEGENGTYAGGWFSQTDDGEATDVEVDLFYGYYGELENGMFYDVNFIYYALLDASDYNYGELHLSVGKSLNDMWTAGVNVDIANDILLAGSGYDDLSAFHISVFAEYALAEDMGLSFEVGSQTWEEAGESDDYMWGRVTWTKDYENFGVEVSAWTNDIDGDDSSQLTASITYSF